MFTFNTAKGVADLIVNQIKDFCENVEIAGSLRRQRPAVNDVDIVVIPKFKMVDYTLFGDPLKENLFEKKLAQMCLQDHLRLEANGTKIKRFVIDIGDDELPIDFYIASPETWYTTLLIRTGSREHNIKLARRAMELHFHLIGDGGGLLSPSGSILPMHSEEEIFRTLDLKYVPPEER